MERKYKKESAKKPAVQPTTTEEVVSKENCTQSIFCPDVVRMDFTES